MTKPVMIPELGDDIKTVKLVEWLIKKGDVVRKREAIAVVETEKVAFEVESPEDGLVETLCYSEGEKLSVSKPIAYIAETEVSINEDLEELKQLKTEKKESQNKAFGKGFRHILRRINKDEK